VGVAGFLVCFAVGSAIIALWIDARAPWLAPTSFRGFAIHVVAAVVAGNVLAPVAMDAIIGNWPGSLLVAVFAVGLPAVTYSFLAAVWLIKLVTGMARGVPH
jgi:hypothetical protein